MVNPYQSVYFSAVGADSVFIGYLLAMNSAVTALMQLVGGYVADAWGRRKVIAVFSFLSAGSAFAFIFISHGLLLILPIMLGAISGIYGPAFNATLTDSMEPDFRARGLVAFTLVTSIPSVFFPYAWRSVDADVRSTSRIENSVFHERLVRDHRRLIPRVQTKRNVHGSRNRKKKHVPQLILDFLRDNSFVLRNASDGAKKLLVYSVLASAGTGMTVPYTALYLVNVLNLSPTFYGILTNVAGLISVLLLLPAARIIETVGLTRSAIYASLSVPVNQIIFVRAKGRDDFVTWTAVGGASGALLGPSLTALQANLTPQEMRGRIMALFSVFSLITSIPAQILGGYLYETLGPLTPFIASTPAFILATLALIRIREPKPHSLQQNHPSEGQK